MHRKYVAIACTVGKLLKEKLRDPKAESLPDELAGLARKLDETSSRATKPPVGLSKKAPIKIARSRLPD
jgi:hypothetical protein